MSAVGSSHDPVGGTFLPLHKRAFGLATGTAAALLVFGFTIATVLLNAEHVFAIGLLSEYFAGYTVTWSGAFVGAAWAGFTGFVMGWFLAFSRNLFVAAFLLYVRARADLLQTRDLLDHI